MKKLSVSLSGHHTSISIEEAFIDEMRRIAKSRNQSIGGIINEIDKNRTNSNLSSAIRVWVLKNRT